MSSADERPEPTTNDQARSDPLSSQHPGSARAQRREGWKQYESLRTATDSEVNCLSSFYAAVIGQDRHALDDLVAQCGFDTNIDLRRALALLSIYVASKSFARWRLFRLTPPEATRARIVEGLRSGSFGDLIRADVCQRYLDDFASRRPHTPIDTTPAGTLSYIVMGAQLLSSHIGARGWEGVLRHLMRRFQRRVRFRTDFPEVTS